jgi:serine acetyltransferase
MIGWEFAPSHHHDLDFYVDRWHMRNKFQAACVTKVLITPFMCTRWVNYMHWLVSGAQISPTALLVGLGKKKDHFRESNLVTIGDGSVVGEDVVFRTHTFENGLLKFDRISVEDNVTIDASSEVMPGAVLSAGCRIAANTIVSKGEVVPPRCLFAGCPGSVVA